MCKVRSMWVFRRGRDGSLGKRSRDHRLHHTHPFPATFITRSHAQRCKTKFRAELQNEGYEWTTYQSLPHLTQTHLRFKFQPIFSRKLPESFYQRRTSQSNLGILNICRGYRTGNGLQEQSQKASEELTEMVQVRDWLFSPWSRLEIGKLWPMGQIWPTACLFL